MSKYTPLNAKQKRYIVQSGTSWLNVLEGGKRSAKNVVNLIAWARCIITHPDKIHLAGGVSFNAAKMNIIDSNGYGLVHLFQKSRIGMYLDRDALFVDTPLGEKIIIIAGGAKENDAARIKGFSIGSVYISEANECHQSFIQECFDRTLASNRRQLFFDLNPKPPRHWFYQSILDPHMDKQKASPDYGLNYAHMTIADNSSLSDEQLRQTLSTYDRDSVWFKRDILGDRTAAHGRIYTGYRHKNVAVTREWIRQQKFIELAVGVDVGGTDATVATLTGFTANFDLVVAIDGYYHKQNIESGMDHAQYAAQIAAFLLPWTAVYPLLSRSTVYAESADKLFRQALRKALDDAGLNGIDVVPSYKKDGILDRINTEQILLNQGRKKIADHLQQWFEAYENATWDSDKYADKEWVRVDDGSYPVDCLDSDEYSTQPYKSRLIGSY